MFASVAHPVAAEELKPDPGLVTIPLRQIDQLSDRTRSRTESRYLFIFGSSFSKPFADRGWPSA